MLRPSDIEASVMKAKKSKKLAFPFGTILPHKTKRIEVRDAYQTFTDGKMYAIFVDGEFYDTMREEKIIRIMPEFSIELMKKTLATKIKRRRKNG